MDSDVSQWDVSLGSFGNNTAALICLKARLNIYYQSFLKLDTDSSSFGKTFNSTTKVLPIIYIPFKKFLELTKDFWVALMFLVHKLLQFNNFNLNFPLGLYGTLMLV